MSTTHRMTLLAAGFIGAVAFSAPAFAQSGSGSEGTQGGSPRPQAAPTGQAPAPAQPTPRTQQPAGVGQVAPAPPVGVQPNNPAASAVTPTPGRPAGQSGTGGGTTN